MGSEMCIRDRPPGGRINRLAKEQVECARLFGAVRIWPGAEAAILVLYSQLSCEDWDWKYDQFGFDADRMPRPAMTFTAMPLSPPKPLVASVPNSTLGKQRQRWCCYSPDRWRHVHQVL